MKAIYYFAFGLDVSRADVLSLFIFAFLIYVLTPLLVILAVMWSVYLFKRYTQNRSTPYLLRFNKIVSIVFLILALVAGLVELLFGSDKL